MLYVVFLPIKRWYYECVKCRQKSILNNTFPYWCRCNVDFSQKTWKKCCCWFCVQVWGDKQIFNTRKLNEKKKKTSWFEVVLSWYWVQFHPLLLERVSLLNSQVGKKTKKMKIDTTSVCSFNFPNCLNALHWSWHLLICFECCVGYY